LLPATNREGESDARKDGVYTEREEHVLTFLRGLLVVNLCKLLFTSTALDYPTPTLIAWEKDFSKDGLLGGGSHVAKITGVLKYLQSLDASKDDKLVVMIDAYGRAMKRKGGEYQ